MYPKQSHFVLLGLVVCANAALAQDLTQNEIIGDNSGLLLRDDGRFNVIVGDEAGQALTSGDQNVFVGFEAGKASTANGNVFLGYQSGFSNTTGFDLTFAGFQSGFSNTTGSDNTFLGSAAGYSTTTGDDNTFAGTNAGYGNTTGDDNIMLGAAAGELLTTGFRNVGVGFRAGRNIGSGWGNTALGSDALSAASGGINNTAIGEQAGILTNGSVNTFVGAESGRFNGAASFNTFLGAYAGYQNNLSTLSTESIRNTYVGSAAGFSNQKGSDNVVVGAFSGSGVWDPADQIPENFVNEDHSGGVPDVPFPSTQNSDVSRRTLIGTQSRANQSDSITIGYGASNLGQGAIVLGNYSQATHANSIVLGNNSASVAANVMVLGNSSMIAVNPAADGVTALGSDAYRYASATAETFVTHADADENASIELIADNGTENNDSWQLRAEPGGSFHIASKASGNYADVMTIDTLGNVTVSGDLSSNSDGRLKQEIHSIENALEIVTALEGRSYEWRPETNRASGRQYGLIAQDVAEVIPEVVSIDEATGFQTISYQSLIPVMVNAVQEQQADLVEQQDAVLAQQTTLDQQEAELTNQNKQLEILRAQLLLQQKQIAAYIEATQLAQQSPQPGNF